MDARLYLTRHAYERYRQRVGAINRRKLQQRCQTAVLCNLYQYGEGVIKLYGVWWGCALKGQDITLTTCYGRQDHDMIAARRAIGGEVR